MSRRPATPDAPHTILWLAPAGQGGNYVAKLAALARRLPRTGSHIVDIAHDRWCLIYRVGYCNCDPTVTVRADGAT
jgi:hypothetical protein